MKPPTLQTVAVLWLLAVWVGGCEPTVTQDKYNRLNQNWLDTQRENRDLARRNQQLEETVGRQNDQIAELQNLGPKRLEKLFSVTGLELGRRSGGVDKDGQDGDDAVIVYAQPVDRDGHVIKAAGDATVQLYDLANPPAENLIGEFHWSVDELGSTWAGGFLGSSQFSLLCPWPAGPPAHDQITIRATFTDYLTGKTFTAQKTVSVHRPGRPQPAPTERPSTATAPASQPASEPTTQPTSALNRDEPFAAEMAAAERAEDRDSKVKHLRKALSCRPDHRDNITIEFAIGIELSQRDDPERQQGPRPAEALAVFEHILKTYRHMDYYSREVTDRTGSPQLMVPTAAILAAGLEGDSAKAKELLISAMEMLKETYDRRVEDWAKEQLEPRPRDNDPFRGGPIEISKWESRHRAWEQRKKDATEGKVFGQLEMAIVRAAVSQFGYCQGPQKPDQVPAIMAQIVRMFPDTPMATVAQEHAKQAATLAEKGAYEKLPGHHPF